ncbi:MAG: cysteine desulfurase [Bacteroidota bacterium]
MFDPLDIRKDFPIFQENSTLDEQLVYLDNAATTQKPQAVIDAITQFYTHQNANIHRGVYRLSAKATELYEDARAKAAKFINAHGQHEVIFTRGTTEAINLVASSFLKPILSPGDEVVISAMEHHSNLVPWQAICKACEAALKVIPINQEGVLDFDAYVAAMSPRVKLVALVEISNTLGTINPISQMIEVAHENDIPVLIDGAQSVLHHRIDVQALDCDFYAFSGHKMFGPTGAGVLYAKQERLDQMIPYQYGGDMIRSVSFEETTYAKSPARFEAGTPDIAAVVGLGAVIDYLEEIDMTAMGQHAVRLMNHASTGLNEIEGLTIIGQSADKGPVLSFVIDDIHPHDIATGLDESGIAVRAGHHCTQPLMRFFEIPGTTRASFTGYNTMEEAEHFIASLKEVVAFWRR